MSLLQTKSLTHLPGGGETAVNKGTSNKRHTRDSATTLIELRKFCKQVTNLNGTSPSSKNDLTTAEKEHLLELAHTGSCTSPLLPEWPIGPLPYCGALPAFLRAHLAVDPGWIAVVTFDRSGTDTISHIENNGSQPLFSFNEDTRFSDNHGFESNWTVLLEPDD